MKKIYLFVVLLLFSITLVACDGNGDSDYTDKNSKDNVDEEVIELTLSELEMYDGKDGSMAYIAVDDVVYDVTDANGWSDGYHNGMYAGNDLTEEIKGAPHGESVLNGLEIVGTIIEE